MRCVLLIACAIVSVAAYRSPCTNVYVEDEFGTSTTLYDFSTYNFDDTMFDFSDYEGQVLLIVATATYSQYTWQLPALDDLRNDYHNQDFEVIAVPTWTNGVETTWTYEEMINSFKHVRPGNGYTPPFPMVATVYANGVYAPRFFEFLRLSCPQDPRAVLHSPQESHPATAGDVGDAFEKFLIDRKGRVLYRYTGDVDPTDPQLHADVMQAINALPPPNNGGGGGGGSVVDSSDESEGGSEEMSGFGKAAAWMLFVGSVATGVVAVALVVKDRGSGTRSRPDMDYFDEN